MSTGPIGTTRNLTQQFVRLRNEAKRLRPPSTTPEDSREKGRLLPSNLSSTSDPEVGPSRTGAPSWVHKSEVIRVEMSLLKERLGKLKQSHQKALLVTFESDTDVTATSEALTREIQSSFKKLDADVRSMATGPGANEDAEVRLQVQRQLAQALFKLSVDFRKEETRFLNKVEQQKGLEQGSSIGLIEDDSKEGAVMDPGFTATQLAMVENSTKLIDERDQEIRKIVETIAELAQIMRDLSTLVVEQGTILDRIDYNIQQTLAKTEEAVKVLKTTEETQKKGRMFLCIVALIVLIVLMLIIVIVRHAI